MTKAIDRWGGGESTRPAAVGLRVLAREISDAHDGASVGVIGLCLAGGFAPATATEPVIRASVACEPSLLVRLLHTERGGIDISPADQAVLAERMASADVVAMLYRLQGDKISPCHIDRAFRLICRNAPDRPQTVFLLMDGGARLRFGAQEGHLVEADSTGPMGSRGGLIDPRSENAGIEETDP